VSEDPSVELVIQRRAPLKTAGEYVTGLAGVVEGHLVVKEPVLVTPAAGLEGEEQLYAEADADYSEDGPAGAPQPCHQDHQRNHHADTQVGVPAQEE